ncbi:MAG: DUF4831 family protein [Prolixibacteraceae bacterium]|jgi:hypothetical protein|nr:DUF4831 family protein [Prolixibacteraceae bacterium]
MRVLTALLLVAGLVASNLSLSAKDDKKKPANELAAFAGGIVYSLPRTGIHIEVEVVQEQLIHGPYFAYAQKYLGINNAAKADVENWTIINIGMETYGEPDPNALYRATGSIATLLSLTDDGVLLGINSEVKQAESKLITNVFPFRRAIPDNLWSDVSMHSFLSEKDTTKRAGSNFKSFEEKAAEAANDILKLRKRKALTLAAKYDKLPPDGDAYKVMVTELDRIIDNYLSLFIGKTFTKKYKHSFNVVPDGKNGKGIVAFRFSPNVGVLPESNVSGKPIMLEIEPNTEMKQKIEATGASEVTTKGIYYRVPVLAQARLLNGADILAQAKITIAQLGVVTALPDGLLNGEYSIEFHPVTGAIRIIKTN